MIKLLSRFYVKTCLSIILLLSSLSLHSQGQFYVTEDLKKAYNHIKELKLNEANLLIDQIKKEEPNNLLVYLIENYIDFYQLFILEDPALFEKLEENKNQRIKKIRSGDPESPYYLFCEAEINIQWAFARIKFDEKITAAGEMYRAYNLLEENKKRFPDFPYNNKSLSFIHVLSKSIPGFIRKILRIDGSIAKGTKEIRQLYNWMHDNPEDIFKDEAVIIYVYILYYQNNEKEKAWDILRNTYLKENRLSSPLVRFVTANIAQKMGYTDQAIEILESRKRDSDRMDFHYLDLLLGKWKLFRLEKDAEIYLEKYVLEFNGKHYIKEAYQKLAWYHLVINEDLAGYKKYMQMVQEYGEDLVDEDKQAQEESQSNQIPHPDLLKARLLFDGGYYQRAYSFLIKKAHLFSEPQALLEYNYRMGRISQALKNYPEALNYYKHVLKSNIEKSYFLCNAALQSALILEEQTKYNQALDFIHICLDLDPQKYKSSLHQKAKSARERIKAKNPGK